MFTIFFSKNWCCSNLKSNQKNPRTELPKRGVNLVLSSKYNSADLMFLFKEVLSLIIRRRYFSSKTNFLSLTLSLLGLTFSLANGEISIWSPIPTLRRPTHSPTIWFIEEYTLKFINGTRCKLLWNTIFKKKIVC